MEDADVSEAPEEQQSQPESEAASAVARASISATACAPMPAPMPKSAREPTTASATTSHIHPLAPNESMPPRARTTPLTVQSGPAMRCAVSHSSLVLRTSGTRMPITPFPGNFPAHPRPPTMMKSAARINSSAVTAIISASVVGWGDVANLWSKNVALDDVSVVNPSTTATAIVGPTPVWWTFLPKNMLRLFSPPTQ